MWISLMTRDKNNMRRKNKVFFYLLNKVVLEFRSVLLFLDQTGSLLLREKWFLSDTKNSEQLYVDWVSGESETVPQSKQVILIKDGERRRWWCGVMVVERPWIMFWFWSSDLLVGLLDYSSVSPVTEGFFFF